MKKNHLTIQIIVKNDEKTIEKCIKSISSLDCYLTIADIGSNDSTTKICENYGIKPKKIKFDGNYSSLRYELANFSKTHYHMYLHPWEAIVQGVESLNDINDNHNVQVLQKDFLNYETRIWKFGEKFHNPVYEYIETKSSFLPVTIYSQGEKNPEYKLEIIRKWKKDKPLSIEPYYYESLVLLSLGKYDDFLPLAEYFIKSSNKMNQASIMCRYYYSLIQSVKKKKIKPAIQNIIQCLTHQPLMAEFWCLAGDIHYLRNDFKKAISLYENAIILGEKRLSNDGYPMDISKYFAYPTKMIDSCKSIINSKFYFT